MDEAMKARGRARYVLLLSDAVDCARLEPDDLAGILALIDRRNDEARWDEIWASLAPRLWDCSFFGLVAVLDAIATLPEYQQHADMIIDTLPEAFSRATDTSAADLCKMIAAVTQYLGGEDGDLNASHRTVVRSFVDLATPRLLAAAADDFFEEVRSLVDDEVLRRLLIPIMRRHLERLTHAQAIECLLTLERPHFDKVFGLRLLLEHCPINELLSFWIEACEHIDEPRKSLMLEVLRKRLQEVQTIADLPRDEG